MTKKKKPSGPFQALQSLKNELQKRDEERAKATGKKPAPPPAPPRPAEPEDEALLLHRLFAGVEPLARKGGSRVPRQKVERSGTVERVQTAREVAETESDAVHERLRALVEDRVRFEVSDDGHRAEGRRIDVPPDMLRKLRRGNLPVDARIDLHGMGAREARVQLELFLRTMRSRGERCVLVIHGKGSHSPQGLGVLRGEIAAWLSQGASSVHVAAFATAGESDGGEGAVYVLLRR
ncbi:MAG TPA: Smr/MutS family protein [Polyangiaceae bacterium]|jgi:DNA-nicking Smr family endonuclease